MHRWQDYVIALSIIAFNIALLPSIFGKDKPRLATSVMTALFLIPQFIAFFTLSLWFSFSMCLVNALLWGTLAVQKYRQK
jgi:hypothetical protein